MANDGTVKIGVEFENTDKEVAALKSQLSSISKAAGTSLSAVTSFTKTAISGTLKAITAAGTAMSGLIGYGVSYNSQIEQYQTSFEVMTGSAEKAAETIDKLKKMGAATPFELTDLADTTQLLMNYGFTADEAIDRMSMLGDIAQGDAEKMNRIATAYGQMSSAGKVSLEDIKQMIEAGFNPLQEISETTGESMESLYERISDGAISVDEITASIQRSTSEGGKYFQSMEKQSKTAAGQISTLKDNFQQLAGAIAGDTSSALSEEFLPLLNEMLGTLQTAFEQGGLEGLADAFGDSLAQLVVIAAEKIPSMMEMGSDVIAAIAQGIRDNADAIFDSLISVLLTLPDFVIENLGIMLEAGSILISKLCDGVIDNADDLAQTAVDMVEMLGSFIIKNAPKLAKAAKELVKALAKAIEKQVPVLKPFTKVITTLADNLDELLPVVLSIAAGFKGMQIIKSVTPLVSNFVTQAKNAATAGQGLSGVLGSFTSPGTTAISIIGGIVTGVGSLITANTMAKQARLDKIYEDITSTSKEAKEIVDSYVESQQNMLEQTKEAAEAVYVEDGRLTDLKDELDTLVDANGRVKEGYEERANYIVNELNEAFDEEILKIENGVIPEYDELSKKIDELIDKKKAAALSDVHTEAYTQALTEVNSYEHGKERFDLDQGLREDKAALQAYGEEMHALLLQNDGKELADQFLMETGGDYTVEDIDVMLRYTYSDDAKTTLEAYRDDITGTEAEIARLQEAYEKNLWIIEQYELAEQAMSEGRYDDAVEYYQAIDDLNKAAVLSAQSSDQEILEASQERMMAAIGMLKSATESGNEDMKRKAYDTMDAIFAELEATGIDGELVLTEPILDGLMDLGENFDWSVFIARAGLAGTDSGINYAQDFKSEYDRLMSELDTTVNITANVIGNLSGFLGGSGSGSSSSSTTTYNTTNHNYIHSTPSAQVEAEEQAALKNTNSRGVGK